VSGISPPRTTRPCRPTEVALKSFFLGPHSENSEWLLGQVQEILRSWCSWRRASFPQDGNAIGGADLEGFEFKARQDKMRALVAEISHRFEGEIPKFSPRYVGHMFSEISVPALLGHILTLLHNPNVIARETATVAADIENEAIAALGQMLGLEQTFGHFTSGGTVANFEAVVRANARLFAWMAVGAAHRLRQGSSLTLFESAQLGWSRYEELRQGISEDELAQFLPELVGPWQSGRALSEAFGENQPFRGPALIVPHSAHYSWRKAARVLGLGEANLQMVDCDDWGRYQVADLKERILRCQSDNQPILAVVTVAGSTETGAIDPIDEVSTILAELRQEQDHHIWHHVDAAYGGFFCSLLREPPGALGGPGQNALSSAAVGALGAVARADSITLDPHKLGYVPYSSGAFLAADARDYTCVRVLAPYVDYGHGSTSTQPDDWGEGHPRPDRGPYTLEGSRSAAGAVATWLTARAIGLDQAGYGLLLDRTIRQKQRLESWLCDKLSSARIFPGCDTNLLCFCVADPHEPVSTTNARTLRILSRLALGAHYYLTKTSFSLQGPHAHVARTFAGGWSAQLDSTELLVLRLCLMNPFFDSSELDVDHVENLVFCLCEVAD
jgi:glutamate/tyrosine decarboxylase-like PLP-dependent enzyme